MKISEIISKINLEVLTNKEFEDKEVTGCYVGDLLSWVMSRAKPNDLWITVMTNVNIIAVATLTDVACIVIPESIELDENTLNKANLQQVVILRSDKTSYELAVALHECI